MMYVQSSIGFVLCCTNQATSGGPDIAIQTSHLLDPQVFYSVPLYSHLGIGIKYLFVFASPTCFPKIANQKCLEKKIPIVVTSPVLQINLQDLQLHIPIAIFSIFILFILYITSDKFYMQHMQPYFHGSILGCHERFMRSTRNRDRMTPPGTASCRSCQRSRREIGQGGIDDLYLYLYQVRGIIPKWP